MVRPCSLLLSSVDVDGLDGVTIDGRPLDSLESLRIGDLLRAPWRAAPWLTLGVALNGGVQAISASVLSALWVDAEHRRPVPDE